MHLYYYHIVANVIVETQKMNHNSHHFNDFNLFRFVFAALHLGGR